MNLNEFFTEDVVSEILKCFANNKVFSYTKDGVTIEANNKNGNTSITCSYTSNTDPYEKDRTEFYDFCDSMNEDLFIEVCESLPNLSEVNNMISGNQVKEGISIFMNTLHTITSKKVAELNQKIDKLSTQVTELTKERNELLKYMD